MRGMWGTTSGGNAQVLGLPQDMDRRTKRREGRLIPWFYVDDGFSDSKPVMSLPEHLVRVPMRLAVCGLWVLGGSWSAKEELDGFIPESKLRSLRAPRSVVDAITGPGSLNAPLCCHESGGIRVKNWQKWQPTKAELEAKRKREAEKKRNQRRRGRSFVTGVDDQMSPGDIMGDNDGDSKNMSPGDSPGPTPPHPNPLLVETECEGPVGGDPGSAHTDSAPPRFCANHPNGTRDRCGDCANARTTFTEWQVRRSEELIAADSAAEDARRRRREAIDNCRLCDDFGRLDDLSDCNHQEAAHA